MSIRPPRPIKALASLWHAYSDPLMLYRLQYQTSSGKTGTLSWLARENSEPDLVLNTHSITIPEGATYELQGHLKTEINGEDIPVCELREESDNSDARTIEVPEQFQGKRLPRIDRRNELR